jgi:hypothetical protein
MKFRESCGDPRLGMGRHAAFTQFAPLIARHFSQSNFWIMVGWLPIFPFWGGTEKLSPFWHGE